MDREILEDARQKLFRHWKPFFRAFKDYLAVVTVGENVPRKTVKQCLRALYIIEHCLVLLGIRVA
jgi:hypothetical protein